ncbi:RNA polymerase sigma factor [Aeromicrobium duanguangcaii]|uniref:RNA polymerase sigma factor n=1 Tax=Aeromicrobium duanguangcaii TaxID=2968086 RepID=A0ABY5K9Q4_9ACTN|nr:sigma-70 family RNA polymerase sigma factor [Aeromicrobium duanguangcaii]MCD9152833.1 sigma-70 family RNA polymerase sigma factor [Aeromicrobium duanguangcaii]UUI67187.1 sigma-70 family RNA polymerase sigma factor [Aeromicrobium duanguangcaii]
MDDVSGTLDALWRIEGSRIVATLARVTGDLAEAEDLAQEALAEALRSWPTTGVPRNPAAWLTTVARRRAIDGWRRREALDDRRRSLARDLASLADDVWQPIDDDLLRLVFTACHPALPREGQVALTLRVVASLSTAEIARLLVVSVPAVQQRIVRAKRTLSEARVPFEVPDHTEWKPRLNAVLTVVYLLFTEGYAATSGDRWVRRDLADEALRVGRVLGRLLPREPEVHGLVALMELQASRFAARTDAAGDPVLLADQDRRLWDQAQLRRGLAALDRVDALGRGRGPYALQAAIAACHATAPSFAATDWERIVVLYDALLALSPGPVVRLNRAAALSMTTDGTRPALAEVEAITAGGDLATSHLVTSVRAELLQRLGRTAEARGEFLSAAAQATNDRERAWLEGKAAKLAPS